MKKILTLLLVSAFGTLQAAVHTVDNNLNSGAQFSSISDAISGAISGDTILVHPSEYTYGDFIINKFVILVGPGHKPEYSGGLAAILGQVSLNSGCNGTVIEGFFLAQIKGSLWNSASDITIRNNYIYGFAPISANYGDNSNSDNWLIEGNVISEAPGCGGCKMIDIATSALQSDNWIFRNNIIETAGTSSLNTVISNSNSTATFANNLFIYKSSGQLFASSNNTLFENNIFWCTSPNLDIDDDCQDCIFNNNFFYNPNDTLEDIPGLENQVNVDPEIITTALSFSYTNDYHLSEGSPAVNAASDGGEVGIYGAEYNFRMEGYPVDHPRITFATPQYIVVPMDTEITIEFGAKRAGL